MPLAEIICRAKIIPVPSLRKGSIIDLKYVVKTKRRESYKKYFGKKIIAGGEYRTLTSNIILSIPVDKHINYHLKGIKKKYLRIIKNPKIKIYNISLKNLSTNGHFAFGS